MKKLTTQEYLNKAKTVHGDKYDYSETLYKDSRQPIKIICKEHGVFFKNAKSHLYGYGCNYCSGKELTFKEFVTKADKIHNGKYIYVEDSFCGVNYPIDIICFEHGLFNQLAQSHLSGCGCAKCSKSYHLDNFEFIKRVRSKFGDKYGCSQVNYINKYTRVTLVCGKHGPFEIIPNNLYYSDEACLICSGYRYNTQTFIEKAIEIHRSRYSYANVSYIRGDKEVILTCKKHGNFNITPHLHLSGSGCPKCTGSRGEKLLDTIFQEMGYNPIKNKSFPGCKYKIRLRFDFFIPEKNTCIEFDGAYHFQFSPYAHKKFSNFIECKIRDKIKDVYCINNKINLIRIPYYLGKDQVNKILYDCLK
jgi:hypothetical protein